MALAVLPPQSATDARVRFYRPELDALRFFAFLLVFTGHTISPVGHGRLIAAVRNAGGFGVPVFFLLSAYLITELLLRERERTGMVSLRRFYMRRMLRIWPLYFGFLALACLVGTYLVVPETHVDTAALVGALLLVGNWFVAHGLHLGVARPLWSISVEEQFYLVWPVLVRFLTRRRVLATGLIVWLASQAATAAMIHHGLTSWNALWFSSVPHVQYFGLGIMLSAYRPVQLALWMRAVLGTLGFGILLVDAYLMLPYAMLTVAGLGAVLIFVAVLGLPMETRGPLQALGKISYGLYVFHMLVVLLVDMAAQRMPYFHAHPAMLVHTLALPLTIGVAAVSYRWYELPFLRLKERFEVIRSRPA